MKKATLFLAIAALLLLASCNVDSEHGIYYQVATSQPSSGYNIVQFITYEGDKLYFLADDGICYTTLTPGNTEYVEGTKDLNIRGAYFDRGNEYYYSRRVDNASEIYKLNTETKKTEKVSYDKDKLDVSPSGFVYNSDGFYKIGTPAFNDIPISNPRFDGESMLAMDGTTKANVFSFSGTSYSTFTGLKAAATGFVEIDEDEYFIFDGKNIYKVYDSGDIGTAYYSDLDSAPTRGYTAVEYNDGSKTYLLVRTSKGFTKIDATSSTSGTLVAKNVQFLSTINDVVVIDMVNLTDGKIAIVTYANGIYIADMVNETLSSDIL